MTIPAETPARQFRDIEEVLGLLRAEGHRVTTSRRIVLEALFAADGPVSAPFITRTTAIAEADVSSVYRNLEMLENFGVVRHVHLGHGPSLYMLVGSGEQEHLVCEHCGRVRSVDPEELAPIRALIHEQFGYSARFAHFPIVGLCADCEAEGQSTNRPSDSEYAHSHGDYIHVHSRPAGADPDHVHPHDH